MATEANEYIVEFVSKEELDSFKIDENECVSLFECAERMCSKFNLFLRKKGCGFYYKRFVYKLEKVTIEVLGSFPYYRLGIGFDMCEPEFHLK